MYIVLTTYCFDFQHMPRIDHNGANFRYDIEYQRLNNANTFDTVAETVEDFHQERLVVSGQATYQPYRIRVRSVNDEGEASDDVTQEIVGFSGEDGEFGWQFVEALAIMMVYFLACLQCRASFLRTLSWSANRKRSAQTSRGAQSTRHERTSGDSSAATECEYIVSRPHTC